MRDPGELFIFVIHEQYVLGTPWSRVSRPPTLLPPTYYVTHESARRSGDPVWMVPLLAIIPAFE